MSDERDAWTGLRILPALHVLLLHETMDLGWSDHSWENRFLLRTAAVSFFFLLSGFLLTRGYWSFRFKAKGRWTFLVGRLARLYPLYLLGILVYTPFYVWRRYVPEGAIRPPWEDTALLVAKHLLLVQAWFPADACTLNCPSWSVSALLLFAVLFAPILFALRRVRPATIWGLALLCFAMAQAIVAVFEHGIGLDDVTREILYKNPLVRLPEFVMGMCLGALSAQGRLDAPWLRHPATFPLAGAAALGLFLVLPWSFHEHIHNGLLAPLLSVVLVSLPHHRGVLAGWLRSDLMHWLGTRSFAVFILHIPVANALDFVGWAAMGIHWRFTWPFILVDVAVTLLVAGPACRWVEAPLRLRLTSWYRRGAAARRQAVAG